MLMRERLVERLPWGSSAQRRSTRNAPGTYAAHARTAVALVSDTCAVWHAEWRRTADACVRCGVQGAQQRSLVLRGRCESCVDARQQSSGVCRPPPGGFGGCSRESLRSCRLRLGMWAQGQLSHDRCRIRGAPQSADGDSTNLRSASSRGARLSLPVRSFESHPSERTVTARGGTLAAGGVAA
jgi:hypothetical protein